MPSITNQLKLESVARAQEHSRRVSTPISDMILHRQPRPKQTDVTTVLRHLVMRFRAVLSTAEALEPLLAYPAASARKLGRST